MKFQKTLLAASLSFIAVTTTHALEAKPVSVTENLLNANPIYQNSVVLAPVHGEHASNSSTDTDFDSTWLPGITGLTNGSKSIDLGTGIVTPQNQGAGVKVKYDVFTYKTQDGTLVYAFEDSATRERLPGTYERDINTGVLTPYKGKSPIDNNTLAKGGKVEGKKGETKTTGFENRQVNGEHVIYGYQGGEVTSNGNVNGFVTNEKTGPTTEYLSLELNNTPNKPFTDIRYVQTGILANTSTGPVSDPSKNIYGVSARNNNNVVMMTGDGIALADLSKQGTLQTDGSIVNRNIVGAPKATGTQKTRQYVVSPTESIVEYYNNDAGKELAPVFYRLTANGLTRIEDPNFKAPALESNFTGTGDYDRANYDISKVQNTVTNKNVTYGESVKTVEEITAKYGVTDADGFDSKLQVVDQIGEAKLKSEQSVSTGVIGANDDKSNKYGLEVTKTAADTEGKLVTTKSSITAAGISTTGFIDAADYRIAGKSISASLTDAVKNAQDAAGTVKVEAVQEAKTYTDTAKVEAVQQAKTYTDTKSTETLAAAQAGDAAVLADSKSYTNTMIEKSGINRMSKRLDNVEETANRGVAIALAANQPMPNIKPGQVAVFGGVGHYEGESAVALGAGTMLADGRTSISGAFGFAGSEIGGRVGLSYTFGQ